MNKWMKATNTTNKQHPKCEGRTCGNWGMCNIYENSDSYIGCELYDEEAQNQMIDDVYIKEITVNDTIPQIAKNGKYLIETKKKSIKELKKIYGVEC